MNDEISGTKTNDEQLHETTGRSAPTHGVEGGDASAEELIEIIESASESTENGLWTTDMELPGFGSEYPDCGDDLPMFCSDCADTTISGSTCYRSTCPRCAASWARRRSSHIVSQLEQLRRYRADFKTDHQRFHHGVISPPSDFEPESEDEWERGLKVVKKILKAADLEGYVFYHPFKGKDGDDRGEWARRLFDELDWDDVADELRFAPHYHVIVVGHEFPGGSVTRNVEGATGWVLHRILKGDSNVSLYDEYDLARAVTYCLSHTGLYETAEQTRAAARPTGANLTQNLTFDPDENDEDARLFRQADAVVRSVAPTTLGLPYNSLACTTEHAGDECDCGDADEQVQVAKAEASRYDPRSLDAGAGDGAEGELGDDDLRGMDAAGDDVEADDLATLQEDDAEPEPCNGRLLNIAKAPAFLADDEWRESAPYADELAETYDEWAERLDWLDPR